MEFSPDTPEQEPTPPIAWTCEHCNTSYEVDDHTTYLFIFPTSDEHTFVQFQCYEESCGQVSNYFSTPEMVEEIAKRVTNIYPMYEVPDWVAEGRREWDASQKPVEAAEAPGTEIALTAEHMGRLMLERRWSEFWEVYDPQPYEFYKGYNYNRGD